MRIRHTYIITLLLAVALLSCKQKSDISLRETFSKKDKMPFGTYVLYKGVEQFFEQSDVYVKKQKLSTVFSSIEDTASLYVCVSKYFYTSDKDNESVLSYANYGNDVFISSEDMERSLLDTLGVKMRTNGGGIFETPMTQYPYKETSVRMQPGPYLDTSFYGYFYEPFSNYFSSFDSSYTKVLGRNEDGNANFIVIFYGSGHIYLHSEPRALSNYFLLQKENYKYMQHLFSFMPAVPEKIYWDDFYNKRNHPVSDRSSSGIAVLMQYPALAKAFVLLLLMGLLYLFFESKRRQRVVPIIPPNTNTTVAFTETVGRLYLQKKNNRNIADKIILYFLEHIRNRYNLNTSQLDANFVDVFSRKSNTPKEETEKLFEFIQSLQQEDYITDHQLLILNQHIEKFYNGNLVYKSSHRDV